MHNYQDETYCLFLKVLWMWSFCSFFRTYITWEDWSFSHNYGTGKGHNCVKFWLGYNLRRQNWPRNNRYSGFPVEVLECTCSRKWASWTWKKLFGIHTRLGNDQWEFEAHRCSKLWGCNSVRFYIDWNISGLWNEAGSHRWMVVSMQFIP